MYCWSSVPSGEIRWTTSIRSGDFFLTVTPMRCTSCGQSRQGDRHAILHQHLGLIDVRSRGEDDIDLQRAIAGGLRHDVEHVVDAVDLLLDRRGDRLGDDVRGGAREQGGHLHGGRRDVGKLRDRQCAKRDDADQRQDDRKDSRKDRSIDEEMGKAHRSVPRMPRRPAAAPTGQRLRSCRSRG